MAFIVHTQRAGKADCAQPNGMLASRMTLLPLRQPRVKRIIMYLAFSFSSALGSACFACNRDFFDESFRFLYAIPLSHASNGFLSLELDRYLRLTPCLSNSPCAAGVPIEAADGTEWAKQPVHCIYYKVRKTFLQPGFHASMIEPPRPLVHPCLPSHARSTRRGKKTPRCQRGKRCLS